MTINQQLSSLMKWIPCVALEVKMKVNRQEELKQSFWFKCRVCLFCFVLWNCGKSSVKMLCCLGYVLDVIMFIKLDQQITCNITEYENFLGLK